MTATTTHRTGLRRVVFGKNGGAFWATARATLTGLCITGLGGGVAWSAHLALWTSQHRREVSGQSGYIQQINDLQRQVAVRWAAEDERELQRQRDVAEIKGQLATLNGVLWKLLTDAEQRAILREGGLAPPNKPPLNED